MPEVAIPDECDNLDVLYEGRPDAGLAVLGRVRDGERLGAPLPRGRRGFRSSPAGGGRPTRRHGGSSLDEEAGALAGGPLAVEQDVVGGGFLQLPHARIKEY